MIIVTTVSQDHTVMYMYVDHTVMYVYVYVGSRSMLSLFVWLHVKYMCFDLACAEATV